MVHVHAKTALTEPVRPGVRQQSGWGEEWASSTPIAGGRAGKALGEVRNGEQDQAPRALSWSRLTATVTATAAANNRQQLSATAD